MSRLLEFGWGIGIFCVWAGMCFGHKKLEGIDTSLVTILGMLMARKAYEKNIELNAEK